MRHVGLGFLGCQELEGELHELQAMQEAQRSAAGLEAEHLKEQLELLLTPSDAESFNFSGQAR